eukprot:NODE_107_length_19843_cov_0.502077.p7 type:complete len:394 gc:universal NODE_107_length_19843_cov_0.502077:14042-15223(+)
MLSTGLKSEFDVEDFMDGLDDWFEEFTNDFEYDSVLTEANTPAKAIVEPFQAQQYISPNVSSDFLPSDFKQYPITPVKQYPKLLPKQQPTPSALHQFRNNQVKQTITSLPLDYIPKKLTFKKVPKRCTGHLVFYTLYTGYFKQKVPDMGKKDFAKMMGQIYKELPPEQKSLFEGYSKKYNEGAVKINENGDAELIEDFIQSAPKPVKAATTPPKKVKKPKEKKLKRKRDLIPENYVCKMTFGNVPVKRRRVENSSEGVSSDTSSMKTLNLSSDVVFQPPGFLSSDVPDYSEFKDDQDKDLPTTPIKPIKLCFADAPGTPTQSRKKSIIKTPIKKNNYSKIMQTDDDCENLENVRNNKSVFAAVDKSTQVSPVKPKVLIPRKYRQFGDEENLKK